MPIRALSSTSVNRNVGGVWDIFVDVRDADDVLVDDEPVVTVTLPDASTATPTVETVTTGVYRVEYIPAAAGRYLARAVAPAYGSVDFTAYVVAVTATADLVDLTDVDEYLGVGEHSWSDETLQAALDAEAAAQRAVCRVPAAYPADLREALLRRVARNLAMKRMLLETPRGDAEYGPPILPGRDPEVRRLEAPHRKLVLG
jgi:hypothetical protein